jgi:hypothetical protein
MTDTATDMFHCPTCDALYKVVRVEAPPTHDNPVLCLGCGGPLQNREGKFALKYFRISVGRWGPKHLNNSKLKLR